MVQQLPFSVGVGVGIAVLAIAVPVHAQISQITISQITDVEVMQTDTELQILLDAEGISEANIFETSLLSLD